VNARTLSGRVALVTGGTTGIGAAITGRLADLGAAVLAGRLADDGTGSALDAPNREIEVFTGDLAQPAACTEIVEACVRRFGRIDVLVNNAAVTGPPALAPFLDAGDEHLDRVIDVNLKAAFRCAREAARRMDGAGVIVNVGSVAAYAAQQHAAAYAAS
jgi:NAD(P)-dependent dehydrogenase (short-subunit alcohol dehydrogenase family)